jgi:hypothetical protein
MWLLFLVLWVAETNVTYHVNIATTTTFEECIREGQRINLLMMEEYHDQDKMWFTCSKDKGQYQK